MTDGIVNYTTTATAPPRSDAPNDEAAEVVMHSTFKPSPCYPEPQEQLLATTTSSSSSSKQNSKLKQPSPLTTKRMDARNADGAVSQNRSDNTSSSSLGKSGGVPSSSRGATKGKKAKKLAYSAIHVSYVHIIVHEVL